MRLLRVLCHVSRLRYPLPFSILAGSGSGTGYPVRPNCTVHNPATTAQHNKLITILLRSQLITLGTELQKASVSQSSSIHLHPRPQLMRLVTHDSSLHLKGAVILKEKNVCAQQDK